VRRMQQPTAFSGPALCAAVFAAAAAGRGTLAEVCAADWASRAAAASRPDAPSMRSLRGLDGAEVSEIHSNLERPAPAARSRAKVQLLSPGQPCRR